MPIALLFYNNDTSTPKPNKDINTMDAGTSHFCCQGVFEKTREGSRRRSCARILDQEPFNIMKDTETYGTNSITWTAGIKWLSRDQFWLKFFGCRYNVDTLPGIEIRWQFYKTESEKVRILESAKGEVLDPRIDLNTSSILDIFAEL